MNDFAVCSRCAKRGQTCCQLSPGEEEFCFPLSEGERIRLVNELSPEEAEGRLVQEPNSRAFVDHLRRLFPYTPEAVERIFPVDGWHWRAATGPEGDCAFLTESGCLLSPESRPLFCQLFPFWQTGSQLHIFAHDECQARLESRTAPEMFECLGTNVAHLTSLHQSLRRAWGLDQSH